jgi:S-adenosylmethionine:tRNA ribosyltransferase-isomerase
MQLSELDFHLPSHLIAQQPAAERAASRLLHFDRNADAISHYPRFDSIRDLLRPGDLLVMNDARVTPARFNLLKPTGGVVQGLFISQTHPKRWTVMLKNLGPVNPELQMSLESASGVNLRVVTKHEGGLYELESATELDAQHTLDQFGRMPLPPYIKRDKLSDPRDLQDRDRYQTVYAHTPGSIAAPTAGLHFTPQLLADLRDAGVEQAYVTLHVGLGTFKPVEADDLNQHDMHVEHYAISAHAAEQINAAKNAGRRIVAVGTTTARVLESQPAGDLQPRVDSTKLLIQPPYEWKHVQALVTNFHLPKSTLIALVAALVGTDAQRRIYQQAIDHEYRFFSYGDAMLVT